MTRRLAAALLLTRGSGAEVEVFLAERAPELRFFGGYLALPGGTLAAEDGDVATDAAAAVQACARRELFEETGLLLHDLPPARRGTEWLRATRAALLAHEQQKPPSGESPWSAVIAATAAPPPLRRICRIETPPFAPVRYDTVFLHVPLEACRSGTQGIAPDVWPGELVDGRFWRPDAALRAWRLGEIWIVPPALILLEHLAAGPDLPAALAAMAATAATYEAGRLHQVRFSPGIVLAPLRTPTLPPATTTNCYIVGRDELWVVDPGSPEPSEQQRLLQLLDELAAHGPTVRGVLATHHHPDHTGGIPALCAARRLEVRGHPLTLSRLPAGCRPGEPLDDGDRIALGRAPDDSANWELRAIHTPGHDRGHLCLAESRYGTTLVGDMLSTMSTIIVDPPEGHLATYLQSLERLLTVPMTTLYPAHGPALRDGQRLVQQYLRHRRQRESTLLQALQAGPATIDELLPKVYWDADPKLYRLAARSLLAGLQKLQEERRAELDGQHWRALP